MSPTKLSKKLSNAFVKKKVKSDVYTPPEALRTRLDLCSPAKARTWVSGLPLTDMGESTRQLFLGLTHLNQSSIAPDKRIEITEIIAPYIVMVLDNLDRHLSRTLPLPERSQKIFDLKKSLKMEIAGSYQLAALEMLTKNSASKKKLILAIGRALSNMSSVLMDGYEIYAKHDKNVWHDIHHLYLIACENRVQSANIPSKNDDQDDMTIEGHYKLINLVSLVSPNTLRQGEVKKVYAFFKESINDVSILFKASEIKAKYAHVALLNSDEPASLMPVSDLVSSSTTRIFDLSIIINHLDDFISLSEDSELGIHEKWLMLTHGLAKRLVYALTTIRNRQYKRFPRGEKLVLAINMADVVEMIRDNDIDLFSDQINADIEDDNIYDALANEEGISSPWADIDDLSDVSDVTLHSWKAENSSSGGYGLRQIKSEASKARVGELVAVKDPKDEAELWQIAVIRWMDSYRGIGLKIGLEILSLHAVTVSVDEALNREITQKFPIEGILLPTIDGARKVSNIIFPSFIFKIDDELVLTMGSRQQHIRITNVDDTVGNFSYCSFDNIDEKEIKEGSLESFDGIWEFL